MDDSLYYLINSLNVNVDSLKIMSDVLDKYANSQLDKSIDPTIWLSLFIALLAVVVGPTIQYIISKRQLENQNKIFDEQRKLQYDLTNKQLNADIINKNRQRWIDVMNELLSNFVSCIKAAHAYKSTITKLTDPSQIQSYSNKVLENTEKSNLYMQKLILKLNPNNELHQELNNLVLTLFEDTVSHMKNINNLCKKVIKKSQEIFVEETKVIESIK